MSENADDELPASETSAPPVNAFKAATELAAGTAPMVEIDGSAIFAEAQRRLAARQKEVEDAAAAWDRLIDGE